MQNAPPWMYIRRGSFWVGSVILGIKRRTDRLFSCETTVSLVWTPVKGSLDGGTVSVSAVILSTLSFL